MSNFKELVRIGKDAVTRHTQAGKAITGFSAAFDNGYGERKQTVWLDCSAWGERWEKVSPYLLKGSQIVVEGSIGTREHDGKTYVTLDVSDLKLVGGKSEGGSGASSSRPQRERPQRAQATDAFDGTIPDDDIPFVTNRGIW